MLDRVTRIAAKLSSLDFGSLFYSFWLRTNGLDFAPESCESLGIPEWTAPHAISGGPDIVKVLERLEIPPGSRCIDFGSGKGIACITLSRHFHHVTGIELSPRLVASARLNMARVGVSNVDFVCADAGTVTDLDHFTHVYMFNPFPAVVMRKVMSNLKESQERKPRPLTIIYKNPLCEDAIVEAGFWPREVFAPKNAHRCVVYE